MSQGIGQLTAPKCRGWAGDLAGLMGLSPGPLLWVSAGLNLFPRPSFDLILDHHRDGPNSVLQGTQHPTATPDQDRRV